MTISLLPSERFVVRNNGRELDAQLEQSIVPTRIASEYLIERDRLHGKRFEELPQFLGIVRLDYLSDVEVTRPVDFRRQLDRGDNARLGTGRSALRRRLCQRCGTTHLVVPTTEDSGPKARDRLLRAYSRRLNLLVGRSILISYSCNLIQANIKWLPIHAVKFYNICRYLIVSKHGMYCF